MMALRQGRSDGLEMSEHFRNGMTSKGTPQKATIIYQYLSAKQDNHLHFGFITKSRRKNGSVHSVLSTFVYTLAASLRVFKGCSLKPIH